MRWPFRKTRGEVPKGYMRRFLPDDPVIVEAGAHNGEDTAELARTWPAGTVHAFEPVPALFEQLRGRVEGLSNVHTFELGLAGASGSTSMHVSGGMSDASSSLLKPKEHLNVHPDVTFGESLVIETVTLDDWARDQDVGRVDLLWLDLQGYELEVLKSATAVLEGASAVYTEVHLVESYEGAPLYGTLRAWLGERGFVVEREEIPWDDGGNVLFVREAGSRG